jgi:3-methylcrotonyl-CoA carboxylase alpha subunit
VDAGYASGDEVSIHYDPMVAKIITWGEDRPAATRKMIAALRETVLLGLTNNNAFLQEVLADPAFQSGDVHTTWVEDHFGDWQPPRCELPPEVLVAAALATTEKSGTNGAVPAAGKDPFSPWRSGGGYRVGNHPAGEGKR